MNDAKKNNKQDPKRKGFGWKVQTKTESDGTCKQKTPIKTEHDTDGSKDKKIGPELTQTWKREPRTCKEISI